MIQIFKYSNLNLFELTITQTKLMKGLTIHWHKNNEEEYITTMDPSYMPTKVPNGKENATVTPNDNKKKSKVIVNPYAKRKSPVLHAPPSQHLFLEHTLPSQLFLTHNWAHKILITVIKPQRCCCLDKQRQVSTATNQTAMKKIWEICLQVCSMRLWQDKILQPQGRVEGVSLQSLRSLSIKSQKSLLPTLPLRWPRKFFRMNTSEEKLSWACFRN